jgi:serine/threonine protein kinase
MKCPRCQHDNPEDTRFCGRCGRELPGSGETAELGTATFQTPTKGLERGTTFARRFEIIEEIGKGGMGTVYKAYDSKIREVVALKLLKPEIASDIEVIERFRNEIKLARQVSHRHVCRMYDLGEEWLSIYISMEYVAGEDLKSFIRRAGHLNEAKALDLAKQILEGLVEAHRLGVVHRDLKPQNIMIDKEGNAKIMDFGIARSLHTKGVTGTGVIIGTPEYMAPEQAEGRDVDRRVDIYALGAILFEMVTGRVPFEGETPLSIVLKHRSEPPADPKAINTQISAAMSQVILKCLEKPRDRRFQNATEVLEALAAVEKGLPMTRQVTVKSKPITTREITVKFSLKKILVPGLIIAAAVIVGLVALLNTISDRGTPAKSRQGVASVPDETGGRTPGLVTKRADVPLPSHPEGAPSRIMSFLAPMLKDPTKLLNEKDAQEVEKVLGTFKEKYPAEAAAFSKYIDSIQTRIQQGKKEGEAGNTEASRKSYDRGESEMRKLLAQVSERERAEAAFKELQDTKQKVASSPRRGQPNLLAWIALEKEKDAADAFSKNDFSGARILYVILAKVHVLSLNVDDEERALAALQELATSIRREAEAALAPTKQAWLFDRAKGEEEGGRQMLKDNLAPQAAERFILAAFLYEKAKEVALESAQAGRD